MLSKDSTANRPPDRAAPGASWGLGARSATGGPLEERRIVTEGPLGGRRQSVVGRVLRREISFFNRKSASLQMPTSGVPDAPVHVNLGAPVRRQPLWKGRDP